MTYVELGEEVEEEGPLEPSKPREEVKQDPYPLPKDFEWATVDLTDAAEVRPAMNTQHPTNSQTN